MAPTHQFVALAGLQPGVSLLKDALTRFASSAITLEETSDGGSFFSFLEYGVRVHLTREQLAASASIISEVHLLSPCGEELPCGIRIGQHKSEALATIRRTYRVTAEYEDSIYFRPSSRDDLLASVEFRNEPVVVGIELLHG